MSGELRINQIDKPWRKEIQRRIDEGFDFEATAAEFIDKAYELKPNGFLLRETFHKTNFVDLDSTVLDIVFCRQSDIHKHTKAGELVRVMDGEGKYFHTKNEDEDFTRGMDVYFLAPNETIYVPPKIPHAFVPNTGTFLEIALTSMNGKMFEDGDQEIELVPFNKYKVIDRHSLKFL
ncbi:MAG: hypothetical protein JXA43_01675 [Candidatus Diapherotrites archaeon]|nr:hypothetical protein [Candidatus Diapherotrites archaeon]